MKKLITTFLLSGLFAFSAMAQSIFVEDFENGMPTTFTLIDVDGNTPNTSVANLFNDPWEVLVFTGTTDGFAASNSWYTPAGQADDWLITPSISLTTSNYVFWNARSADPSVLETYEVLISTTGTATTDFTLLTTISGENATWTPRQFDLTAYNNQTVYLAFRNISNDKYILAIDDIDVHKVYTLDAAVTSIATGDLYSSGDSIIVTADVKNMGLNNITSFDLNWSTDGGTTVNTDAVTGINLAANAVMTISHSQVLVAANAGSYTDLEVWVSNVNSGIDLQPSNDSLSKSIFVNQGTTVDRKVLLEEFTTAVCQFCPDGALKVEQAVSQNPDIIPVGVHSGFGTDAMTTPAASAYASFTTGAPTAMVDRVHFDGEANVAFSRATQTVPNLWLTRANTQDQLGAPASIDINGSYNSSTRVANLTVNTDFVDYVKPGDLRVTLYVIEDSVTGTGNGYDQINAYYNDQNHPFYNIGIPIASTNNNVSYIPGYVHRHVLRKVYPLNQYWGDSTVITGPVTPTSSFSKSYSVTLSNNWDEDQVSFVAYISYYDDTDLSNRYILNATSAELVGTIVGIDEKMTNNNLGMKVYPNPFKDETNVGFVLGQTNEVSIQLYDVAGKLLMERNLGTLPAGEYLENIQVNNFESGFYFIKLNVGNSTMMKKVSLLK